MCRFPNKQRMQAGCLLLGVVFASFGQAAETSAQSNSARAVLRAEREAVLSSGLSERITKMPFREGDRFAKGATLVEFDCGRLSAELNAAKNNTAVEARSSQVQRELLSQGATGKADADIAGLKVRQARAQANAIQQQMSNCKVVAPFAGRVVETMARVSESPQASKELIHIVSDGSMELHMIVPSRWLRWLKPGSDFAFTVDETGDTLTAVVSRISAAVDPVSQTVKIICTVKDVPDQVLPGMSGKALFNEPVAARHDDNKARVMRATGIGAIQVDEQRLML